MDSKIYVAPLIDVLEVECESGMALSDYSPGGPSLPGLNQANSSINDDF